MATFPGKGSDDAVEQAEGEGANRMQTAVTSCAFLELSLSHEIL